MLTSVSCVLINFTAFVASTHSISLDYDQPQQNKALLKTLSTYGREHITTLQHSIVCNPFTQSSSMEEEAVSFLGIKGTPMHNRSKWIKENVTKATELHKLPRIIRRSFSKGI